MHRLMMQFESAVGAMAMTMLGGIATVLAFAVGITAVTSGRNMEGMAWLGAAIVGFPLELALVLALMHAYDAKQHPVAVAVSLKQPVVPMPLRPLAALWWGGHFVFASTLTLGFILWSPRLTVSNDPGEQLLIAGLCFLLTLGFTYATFGYLLLAVTSINPEPQVVGQVWRHRGAVNLTLALLSAVFAWSI